MSSFAVLRDPNVARVVVARFVSRIGGEAAFFVGVWGIAAFELDAGAGQLAMVMGSLGASSLLGAAVGGVLVDRYGPRRVLIGAELLFVPATLAMTTAGSIAELVVLSAAFGFVSAPVFTAVGSFAPYLTDDQHRLQGINSIVEAAAMAALVVGPGLGAVIVAAASVDWVFVLDAATSVIAALLVARVVTRPVETRERRSGGSELREGLVFSYRRPMLRFVMLSGTLVWLAVGSFGALEPLFFRDVLGVDVETLGWVFSIFGAGLVAGAATLGRAPRGVVSARGLAVVVAACGAGAVLYVGTDRLTVVAIGAAVWGVIVGWLAPLIRTLLQMASPEPLVGRIAGVYQMHLHVAELLPLTFAPALAAILGVQAVLVWCGVILAVLGLAALLRAGRVDAATALPEPPSPGQFVLTDEPTSPVP